MPAYESESKYPETTRLIFGECSKRLKKRKLSLKLTDTEIAGNYDRKVVNRILNNTRGRNNPYLIPHAYIQLLVEKLELQSEYELFWGDKNDETFVEAIFVNLIADVLDESDWNETYWEEPYWSKNSERVDLFQKTLLDYVPYAKIYPSVTQSYETVNAEGDYIPISPLAYLTGGEHPSFEKHRQVRQNAIVRLFLNTRPIKIFRAFFQETKSFSKIDKKLDAFVAKSLMPFMEDNLPTEKSLGLRVFSIVSADFTNYVESELINIDRTAAGFDKCNSQEYDEILDSLMEAGRDYIDKIEGLQVRLDELHRKEKFGR